MVRQIQVKTLLNRHRKRDEWFLDDYSINPYSSCYYNCLYCYIRGSKYGYNLTEHLSVKVNAPEVLERELAKRAGRGEYGVILLSSATEAYPPIEEELKLTQRLLKTILKHRFPIHIVTKSPLVLRDLDLLRELDGAAKLPPDLSSLKHGVIISFSLSTLDDELAKLFEPGAPKPWERLEAANRCVEEGFLTGIAYIPVLPFLSDSHSDLDSMVSAARDCGVKFVFIGALTLFGEAKQLYYRALEKRYPELIPKYEALFRGSFTPDRSYRMRLEQKAIQLCRKYGVSYQIPH